MKATYFSLFFIMYKKPIFKINSLITYIKKKIQYLRIKEYSFRFYQFTNNN